MPSGVPLRSVVTVIAAALAAAFALATTATAPAPLAPPLEVPGFSLEATARARDAAELLALSLSAERDALAARLGIDYPGTTRVRVGDGPAEIAAIAPAGVAPPRWASGLALPEANLLLLDARAVRGERGRALVRHELAHLALGRLGAAAAWPRWFQEGFAMLVAGEWSVSRYFATWRASHEDQAIPLAALTRDWPDGLSEVEVAYAESLSFVSFLYDTFGEDRFRRLIGAVASGAAFDDAFAASFGTSLAAAEANWRSGLASRYRWVPLLTGSNAVWAVFSILFVVAGLRMLRRRRERLAQLEREEAEALAAARAAASPFAFPDAPNGEPPTDESGGPGQPPV